MDRMNLEKTIKLDGIYTIVGDVPKVVHAISYERTDRPTEYFYNDNSRRVFVNWEDIVGYRYIQKYYPEHLI